MGLLGGVLTGLLGGSEANPTGASPNAGAGLPLPSLPGLPGLPTLSLSIPPIFPTDSASSSESSSAPPAPPVPPASASSVPPSASSVSSTPPSSSSAPPSSSFTPTSSSPSASPTATSLPDVSTDNNGNVHTISHVVTATENAATTESAAPVHHESFLENKALSGTVFALAGLVALVLLVVLVTCVFRRRRRNRLLDDAVSFDPSLLATADRYDGSEKGHSSNASLGTLGGARPTGYGTTYQAEPVQQYNPYGGVQQQQPAYYGAPQPAHQPEYYGDYGAPQPAQQPYYSAYVPPMTDAPPSTLAATTPAPAPRATHNIPRVPVPAKPLPEEFGSSDQNNRTSIEESEFWAKTLKVANE